MLGEAVVLIESVKCERIALVTLLLKLVCCFIRNTTEGHFAAHKRVSWLRNTDRLMCLGMLLALM